jgi:hypothetical protein
MVASEVVQVVGKELLDNVTKALALFISLTYVMGLIIVNSFLLTFGVRTVTLLSIEYISAGLPLALLFLVAGLTAALFSRKQQRMVGQIATLVVALLLLGLIMLYVTNLEDYLKTLRTTGIIFVLLTLVCFAIIKDFNHYLQKHRERLPFRSSIYGLILLVLVVVSSTFYGRTVYNDILPTIGGGAESTISLITDAANASVLAALVPMQSELQTEPIQLIRETNESYLILRSDDSSISIDKDLVKGVVHHKTRGWEIKPSIFD